MGRELKRVALDFVWPLDKVWTGYINPHPCADNCPHCDGLGYSPRANELKDLWYGYVPFKPEDRGSKPFLPSHPAIMDRARRNGVFSVEFESNRLANLFNAKWMNHLNADDVAALVEAGRLMDLTHVWTQGEGWKAKDPAVTPTAEQVNAWSISGMGHDSINQYIVGKARCAAEGVSDTCEHCAGSGEAPQPDEARALRDAWQQQEPPAGDGYQIWETVSEGSPISPVFATPEELARHMTTTRWGADKGSSYETWLNFINGPGWAPSMIADSNGIRSGVDALS